MVEQNNKEEIHREQEGYNIYTAITQLWNNRRFILWIVAAFLLLGLLFALLSQKKYTVSTIMVPQVDNKKGSALGGLASMVGIDLGALDGSDVLSPTVYPNILASNILQKELIHTPIEFSRFDSPVSLYQFYTEKSKRSFVENLKRYTIGLPWLIVEAIKGEQDGDISRNLDSLCSDKVVALTREELDVIDDLSSFLWLDIDTKEGRITLKCVFIDPLATASLAREAQKLLQSYLTKYKLEKVKSNVDFIEARYVEAKKEYDQKQREYARFADSNMGLSTMTARNRLKQIEDESRLAYTIYSELAVQLEKTKISEKETTPILTVIDPVTIPLRKSHPQTVKIMAFATFLGLILGAGIVVVVPIIGREFRIKRWADMFPMKPIKPDSIQA